MTGAPCLSPVSVNGKRHMKEKSRLEANFVIDPVPVKHKAEATAFNPVQRIAFISALKGLSRPDAAIQPVVTEESTHPQRRQPFESEPTADNCSAKADHRPHKKTRRMFELKSHIIFSRG